MLDRCKPFRLAGLILMAAACALPVRAQVPAQTGVDAPGSDASVPDGQTVALEQAVSAPAEQWQLSKGLPVHTQLQAWAGRGGWTLDWQPKVSWLVAGDVSFEGSFEQVLTEVIESLFFEGKPVRLVLWQGNRLAEVIPSDIR